MNQMGGDGINEEIFFAIFLGCLFFALQASSDDSDAIEKTRIAAAKGSPKAQFYLGLMYHGGDGVAQDKTEAVRLYRLAAEQGLALAQVTLGFMHYVGDGVAQDKPEAARLYRLAAEQGLAIAQLNLGGMYSSGDGVAQDAMEALKWLMLADENRLAGQYDSALTMLGHRATLYGNPDGVSKETLDGLKRLVQADGEGDWNSGTNVTYTNNIGMELVLISAGSFIMGSDPFLDRAAAVIETPSHNTVHLIKIL
ncbi:MAG: sel1 repeat family protein [Deltaproteobacteria bacterium]|jgi:TPR repeat protein|nr:sel1 repeat family protein [Deltaproteobacteria bacterium]